jgi:hypothetical protein
MNKSTGDYSVYANRPYTKEYNFSKTGFFRYPHDWVGDTYSVRCVVHR